MGLEEYAKAPPRPSPPRVKSLISKSTDHFFYINKR